MEYKRDQIIRFWLAAWNDPEVGFAIVSTAGILLDANQAFCEQLGYTKPEIIDRHVSEITAPADAMSGMAEMERVVAGQVGYISQSKDYAHKRGHLISAQLYSRPIRNDGGSVDVFVSRILFVRNGTRAAAKMAQMSQQIQQLERFVGNLAGRGVDVNLNKIDGNQNQIGNRNDGAVWKWVAMAFIALALALSYVAYYGFTNGPVEPPQINQGNE